MARPKKTTEPTSKTTGGTVTAAQKSAKTQFVAVDNETGNVIYTGTGTKKLIDLKCSEYLDKLISESKNEQTQLSVTLLSVFTTYGDNGTKVFTKVKSAKVPESIDLDGDEEQI